jgi:hypothetical protein
MAVHPDPTTLSALVTILAVFTTPPSLVSGDGTIRSALSMIGTTAACSLAVVHSLHELQALNHIYIYIRARTLHLHDLTHSTPSCEPATLCVL